MDKVNNITKTAAAAEPGKILEPLGSGVVGPRPVAIVSAGTAPVSAVLPTSARRRAHVCRLQDHP